MTTDAPVTTPPPSDSPELDELAAAIAEAIEDLGPYDDATRHAAAAVLAHLAARVRVDDAGVSAVPDWYVRLDGVADADAFPMGLREDVAAALRYIAELHIVASRAWRERDAALRGTQRALMAQREATDSLALALLAADDSLTPQHSAQAVAELREACRAARAVVNDADDRGTVGSGDAVMFRLAQSLAAVES